MTKPTKKTALALSPPKNLHAARFEVGGDEYAILSYPARATELPATLTSTELEIYRAVLAGHSNAKIATERERSLRTVANQVAAIFAKLGVSSRAELIAGRFAAPRRRVSRAVAKRR
jgi:DNA-binding NarL/FixJ family response regulator